jgi:ABC-type transport system involved in multi-copper enzyme maturation permease subunit
MIPLLRRSLAQGRYVLVGVLLLLFGFQLIIIAQAAEVERSNAFASVANLMPAFMQRGLGSRAMLLATFRGTVTFGYFHPVVCILVAVLAMYFATEPAHEVEAGLVDLELARAVPRHRLITRSLLVAFAAIGGATAMMALGTWTGARVFDTEGMAMPAPALRAQLLMNLFAVAVCLAGFALMMATFSRRWATSFTTAGLAAVVAYMVDFIAIGWPPMRTIAWLSPFHYYPALSVVAGDASTGRNIAVLLATGAVFVATAYWQFQRRDV